MIRKLYIIANRWWRTTLYLKKWKPQMPLEDLALGKWKPNEEQVLPTDIKKGVRLRKYPKK